MKPQVLNDMSKYGRGPFIYLEPRPIDGDADYAQCGSCRMFVPEMQRCIIHGAKVDVDEDDSCGFWVPWPKGERVQHVIDDHAAELKKGVGPSVTPEESGLVDDRVQCHRCVQFDSKQSKCALYDELNKMLPKLFDIPTKVHPHACCNAWTDDGASAANLKAQIRKVMKERS